jgi:hypothetical protein
MRLPIFGCAQDSLADAAYHVKPVMSKGCFLLLVVVIFYELQITIEAFCKVSERLACKPLTQFQEVCDDEAT